MVWWVIGEPLCSLAEAGKLCMARPKLCALESREQGIIPTITGEDYSLIPRQ